MRIICQYSKMIPCTTFYSKNACTKVAKCTTLHEAIAHAQSKKTTKVVLLPPQAGNQEMNSYVKSIPDELPNQEDEFELFEPAGEMEIEDEVEESDDDKEEEVIQPKRRKHSHGHPNSKWKQTITFFKELPSESLENFADNHQHLLGKSPFDL